MQLAPQSYSGIPNLGMKFNGDSLAVNNDAFSSMVNNEIKLSTRSSIDNEVLQKGKLLKFLEHATGIVSPLDRNMFDKTNMISGKVAIVNE